MAGKSEVLQKVQRIRSEVSKLKSELSSLSREKAALYSERSGLMGAFMPVVQRIRGSRQGRDKHTGSVKELKSARSSAAAGVKDVASQLSALRAEKLRLVKKLGVTRPASAIEREIKRLEYSIETSAMPFDREQRLMKVIKEMKAELAKAGQLTGINSKIRELSASFDELKSVSDKSHAALQLHASVSQKLHEEMLSYSGKAAEIRAKLKPVDGRISDVAKKYSESKSLLLQKISELDALEKELAIMKAEEERQRKLEEERILEARENELTEKIKSGRKLTRDDLIKLQKG